MATMLPGGAARPFLAAFAHGADLAVVLVQGDDGGLVDHDPPAVGEDQGVGRAQVNGQVGGKDTEERAEAHGVGTITGARAFPQGHCTYTVFLRVTTSPRRFWATMVTVWAPALGSGEVKCLKRPRSEEHTSELQSQL